MIRHNITPDGTKYYDYAVGDRKRMVGVVSTSEHYLKSMISWLIKLL